MRDDARFNRIWYEGAAPAAWMIVLSWLYGAVTAARRSLYRLGVLRATRLPVPVVVVGNLVAGGAGKTPLTLALVSALQQQGWRPGIVSRGYGGARLKTPLLVDEHTAAQMAGDEPVMLARRLRVPVVVHPKRARAAHALLAQAAVDVIVCDDGLQHYALARDIEIVVIDGQRGLGNGRLLPAGPLRERANRVRQDDFVITNGELGTRASATLTPDILARATVMRLQPQALVNLVTGERRAPDALNGEFCAAVAGIGNPQRFFETLGAMGYAAECRAFPDHHSYAPGDLAFAAERPLLMTEKDAVKCRAFARAEWWYLEIGAALETDFMNRIVARVEASSRREQEKTA